MLGGGFAGAYVARQLGRNGATIVNPTNFMLYTPLLPEAAAGNIEPRHVVVPLRTMCPARRPRARLARSRSIPSAAWSRCSPRPAASRSPTSSS